MSDAELNEALAAWGATGARFIKGRENAVYEAALPQGRAALRLHRVGYQSAAAIRSEMVWMDALASAGLSVPAPIPALDGAPLVRLATDRMATMLSWVDGTPLGAADMPLGGAVRDRAAVFHAIGRETARLHNLTDRLVLPPDFQRPSWDVEGLLGDDPLWGRFWENPALNAAERSLVQTARTKARMRLNAFQAEGGDYGLIHADLLRENLFLNGETVTLIDFDDAGYGFRLYDLATLMSQNETEPDYPALRDAAIAGYRTERPLPDAAVALLPMFILLRRLASMGWIMSRVHPGEDRARIYTDRAVKAARGFLV